MQKLENERITLEAERLNVGTWEARQALVCEEDCKKAGSQYIKYRSGRMGMFSSSPDECWCAGNYTNGRIW